MTTPTTTDRLAEVLELLPHMNRQLYAWEGDEPREDWWQYQRDFDKAYHLLQSLSTDLADAELQIREQNTELQLLRAGFANAEARVKELEEVVAWYGENARLCRLIHSEGDKGRHELNDDGGKRARAALNPGKERV